MAAAKKLPSFQFYPGDWQKDPNLRRCSHSAKGIWIDMLCLMFECDERGVLATAGRPWTREEIAQAVGGDYSQTLSGIEELSVKGVVNLRENGAYYSRRMVRDEQRRATNIANGRKGGNPALTSSDNRLSNRTPNRTANRKATPSSSTSVEDAPRAAGFVPPSVSEVRDYCVERKNRVNPDTFVDFYTGKGWMIGKNKMKDWRAAVRTWEKSDGTNGHGTANAHKNAGGSGRTVEHNRVRNPGLLDQVDRERERASGSAGCPAGGQGEMQPGGAGDGEAGF